MKLVPGTDYLNSVPGTNFQVLVLDGGLTAA